MMSSEDERVLAVGSATSLVSLVGAWYEAGLSNISVVATNRQPDAAKELRKALERALPEHSEAGLVILDSAIGSEADWEAMVQPFAFIMYIARHDDLAEFRQLQAACVAAKKPLLPAIGFRGMGLAGPLLLPEDDGAWASPWRRVHASVFPANRESQPFPDSAMGILANLVVNEWRNAVNSHEPDCRSRFYLLNPLTLEGSWHPLLPYPALPRKAPVHPIMNLEQIIENEDEPDPEEWFAWFSDLTSEVSGIFRVWEEGTLDQLPLARCLVQPAAPLSEGPSGLLPAIVGSGLTHVEARRESGLAGIEAYVSRMAPLLLPDLPVHQAEGSIRIGAGLTFAEAVERGLRACLTQELSKLAPHHELQLARLEPARIDDVHCRYYLQALTILEGEPLLAAGESVSGFPVVWIRSGPSWHAGVGFTLTLALRQSLQHALMNTGIAAVASVNWKHDPSAPAISIPSGNPADHVAWMQSAARTLRRHRKRLEVFDMRYEAFLSEGPVAVVGVRLGEETSL